MVPTKSFRVRRLWDTFPGCDPASRPWAVMCNPFGVQRTFRHSNHYAAALISDVSRMGVEQYAYRPSNPRRMPLGIGASKSSGTVNAPAASPIGRPIEREGDTGVNSATGWSSRVNTNDSPASALRMSPSGSRWKSCRLPVLLAGYHPFSSAHKAPAKELLSTMLCFCTHAHFIELRSVQGVADLMRLIFAGPSHGAAFRPMRCPRARTAARDRVGS